MSLTEFNEAEFVANRRAEGRTEAIEAVVVEMICDGMENSEIMHYTKCPLQRIEQLRENLCTIK